MGIIASFYNKFWADYTFSNNMVQCVDSDTGSSSSQPARVWAPPQKTFYKLNTDGSWIDIDNAGGGGVLRCEKGL